MARKGSRGAGFSVGWAVLFAARSCALACWDLDTNGFPRVIQAWMYAIWIYLACLRFIMVWSLIIHHPLVFVRSSMARGNGLRTTWHADPLNFAPGLCVLSCVSGIGARDKGKLRNCCNVSEAWLKKGQAKQQGKGWFWLGRKVVRCSQVTSWCLFFISSIDRLSTSIPQGDGQVSLPHPHPHRKVLAAPRNGGIGTVEIERNLAYEPGRTVPWGQGDDLKTMSCMRLRYNI